MHAHTSSSSLHSREPHPAFAYVSFHFAVIVSPSQTPAAFPARWRAFSAQLRSHAPLPMSHLPHAVWNPAAVVVSPVTPGLISPQPCLPSLSHLRHRVLVVPACGYSAPSRSTSSHGRTSGSSPLGLWLFICTRCCLTLTANLGCALPSRSIPAAMCTSVRPLRCARGMYYASSTPFHSPGLQGDATFDTRIGQRSCRAPVCDGSYLS